MLLRRFSHRRIVALFFVDWLGTLGMLALADWVRLHVGALPGSVVALLRALQVPFGGGGEVYSHTPLSWEVFGLVAVIWPFFFALVFCVYDSRRSSTFLAEWKNVFAAGVLSTLALAGVLYLSYRDTPRVTFLVFLVLDAALLLGARLALWVYRRALPGAASESRRLVLVVGAGQAGQQAVVSLRQLRWASVHLVGFADDDPGKQQRQIEGLPVLGTLGDLAALVGAQNISDALMALPLRAYDRLVESCRVLQRLGVRVHVVPDLFALSFPGATLDGFGGIPVISLGLPSISGARRALKQVFDILAASALLLLAAPVMLLIAVAIKLESPGPVFFRQKRVGENGRLFTFLKFRSMRVNNEASVHEAHVRKLIEENTSLGEAGKQGQKSLKLANDPRITGVGRFIRKFSLDELPQLFNVLRGEMSLVGPRPALEYEMELYKDWHRRRFEAIPGITGLWQVKGRNRVSFDEMVRMDLEYIEHQSFWLDLKILLRTPWAVLSGKGAG